MSEHKAGLASARARGRKGGAPFKMTAAKLRLAMSAMGKCAAVTAQIIEQLDAGVAPWVRPWSTTGVSDMPTNFATRRTNRGANVLNLWTAQTARGYDTAEWMTFKQAIDLGACVCKGEHGTPVFFVSALEREEPNAKGELVERHLPFWKSFTVFNIAQVDGLPARLPVAPRPEIERLASVDAYLAAVGATVRLGGDRAFYSPATDSITLPRPIRSLFRDLSNLSPSPPFTRRRATNMP